MLPLRRLNRAVRRLPWPLILLVALPFFLEAVYHNWQYQVPRPSTPLDAPFFTACQEPDVDGARENAVFVMLARNKERHKAKRTIRSIEAQFNRWFAYPILFLNDEPWDPRFVSELNATAGGKGIFEVIPKEHWSYPDWMDQDVAKKQIKAQGGGSGGPHAGLEGYHHMCRFYSGKFYNLDVLKKYKWYWRLEPDVEFTCAITYDPFAHMAKRNKVYGFTIALWEVGKSCPGLFRATTEWKESRGVAATSLWKAMMEASWMPFPFRRLLSWIPHRDSYGDAWSLCHFWNNFEIADMDFFRSKAYGDYFDYLDKKGGFYSERWGDAAVHSLAVAMLADPQQVHHFEDIGYRHDKFYQCPENALDGQLPNALSLSENKPWTPEVAGGIGCRCKCTGKEKLHNYQSYCLDKLKQPNTPKSERGRFTL